MKTSSDYIVHPYMGSNPKGLKPVTLDEVGHLPSVYLSPVFTCVEPGLDARPSRSLCGGSRALCEGLIYLKDLLTLFAYLVLVDPLHVLIIC